MDKQIAEMWADALESGEYRQGREYLCFDNRYCCLGVLCELYVKNTNNDIRNNVNGTVYYDNAHAILPECVLDWASIGKNKAAFSYERANAKFKVDNMEVYFASWNDGEENYFNTEGTFPTIAKAIREHWEKI